jgi:putative ABC transport system ATP-binding protein
VAHLHIQQLVTRHVGPVDLLDRCWRVCLHRGGLGQRQDACCCAPSPTSTRIAARCGSMTPVARACRHPRGGARWPCWSPRASGGRKRIGDHFEYGVDAAWIEGLGLPAAAMDWQVARCSTGERQRFALLRTLMQAPGCPVARRADGKPRLRTVPVASKSLLEDYRRQRQAPLLWVSHDPAQIERVAQRSFTLDNGRLQERGRR